MAADALRGLLPGVYAVLMVIAVTSAASSDASSVVVGLAKCADCTRKNLKAEAAFKGIYIYSTNACIFSYAATFTVHTECFTR
jgi:hypothetical protein